jgi:hypothetical protein
MLKQVKFDLPVTSSSSSKPHQVAATVEVTAQPATTTPTQIHDEAITVQAWTNVGRQPVNASQTPILLYAEVRRGLSPVLDAKVTALVYPPRGQDNNGTTTSHHPPAGPFVVQLFDKGTGGSNNPTPSSARSGKFKISFLSFLKISRSGYYQGGWNLFGLLYTGRR